jgi:hypothetical protein
MQVGDGAVQPIVKLLVGGVNLAVLTLGVIQGIGSSSQGVAEARTAGDWTTGVELRSNARWFPSRNICRLVENEPRPNSPCSDFPYSDKKMRGIETPWKGLLHRDSIGVSGM